MEAYRIGKKPLLSEQGFMASFSTTSFRGMLCCTRSVMFRCFCTSLPDLTTKVEPIRRRNCSSKNNEKVRAKVSDAQLKEEWLNSLTCPVPAKLVSNVVPQWVIGVDPDVSGALALLKFNESGCSAQVFDSPHLKVLVGNRIRRRLDPKAIVEMLQGLDVPIGTTAYVEQSLPYPQDGKQGWWSGGFNYGLWIGVLVASEVSVVPVPPLRWKNEFNLSGNRSSKDYSREVACTLFPSVSSLLRRKKDHGRAEALLIAAYGKGLKMTSDFLSISTDLDAFQN